MAGFFPQGFVNDLRALDLQIPVVLVDLPHVLLNMLPQAPALGMPEHQTRGMLVDMEKIEFTSQLAVIPLLRLFQHGEVLLQIFFARPCRAVNPLQHLVAVVATPVRAGYLHQLEMLQLARAGYVRAAAQVFKRTLTVQADVLARRNAGNDFGLVVLAHTFEVSDGFIARQNAAQHGLILGRQLCHALFNRSQVLWCEGPVV